MSNTEIVTLPSAEPTTNLARFMPQNITELTKFADTIARSGLFGDVSPQQALVIMIYGSEVGLNPLAAMREIYVIPGKNGRMQMLPSAALTSARIQQSEDCIAWETDVDDRHCTIRFQRRGRQPQTITVTIEDIPKRYFAPSKSGQPSQWTLLPSDMLYAWTVRRVARRHFADKLIAIQPEVDEIDETRVIDVAKVERSIDHRQNFGQCAECFHGAMFLEAGRNGGAYLRCNACGATTPPPQEVRDLIRGTPEHLTLAGAAEPALEPGERLVESAPESVVQSEYEDATLDGEDVVAVPASAEAPIPTPDGPESAEERHLAMRNAIYSHWIMPRPTANKIEMRQLLEDFGWDGGETLGDWMLHLDELKLAAIADAIAGIA